MSLTAARPVAAPRRSHRRDQWSGTGDLVRLALRRDRVLLPAWLVGFSLMAVFSAAATRDLYPDPAELATAAETINATAALVALYGKVYVTTSLGAVSLIKLTAFGSAFVAVLLVFVVVRHSRAEEESGRLELVAAGVVGRAAPLTAALLVGAGTSLMLGALTTLGLGLGGLPWAGSVAFGLAWALSGIVFSAVAGVAAQLTTSARAAIGLGLVGVGIAYALRAVGDLSSSGDPGWLSWLSPIGWSQQIRPFAGDRWWVSALPLLATAVLVPVAFGLRARRDLGSGLLPQRAGPAVGTLGGVGALAWRLQRGAFVAWLAATAAMGIVLGTIANNVSGFLDSPQMQEFVAILGGEQSIVDSFLAAEIGIFGAIIAAFGVSAALHVRSEETSGHAELLLGTPATRVHWAGSHLGVALLGTAAIMLVTGSSVGLGYGLTTGEPLAEAARLGGAAALQLPAAWVMVGIVVVLLGWVPLAAPVAWGLLAGFVVLGEFGGLWQLPQWALDLSPFAHSPTVPGGSVSVTALAGLLVVAGLLIGTGVLGLRRRDIPA